MHNFKEPDILLRDPALFISSYHKYMMTFCKLWLMELFLRRLVIYQFVVRRYKESRIP